jgi:Skp family chaperone for outer membrane proteins
MMLLFLGFTFGIIFTSVANKREVDNLNDLLNQTTNLVQDLHEELDMKDLYIVKEVGNEEETDHHKAEDSEAICKIEAELEAELERLELNMKTSSLERISDYVEVIMAMNIIKFGCIQFALTWTVYDHLIVMWFCYMYWNAS